MCKWTRAIDLQTVWFLPCPSRASVPASLSSFAHMIPRHFPLQTAQYGRHSMRRWPTRICSKASTSTRTLFNTPSLVGMLPVATRLPTYLPKLEGCIPIDMFRAFSASVLGTRARFRFLLPVFLSASCAREQLLLRGTSQRIASGKQKRWLRGSRRYLGCIIDSP